MPRLFQARKDFRTLSSLALSRMFCTADFTDITPIPGCKKPTPVQPATLME